MGKTSFGNKKRSCANWHRGVDKRGTTLIHASKTETPSFIADIGAAGEG